MKISMLDFISYVAIFVIVVSLFFIGMKVTGYATSNNETGVVNVTITSSAALSFTTAFLDFGNGAVSGGQPGATINSESSVTGGTWSPVSGQLVLENVGNVNVSLTLSTNKSVASFIGGTSPTFKAKVSDKEAGACTGGNFTGYHDINQTLQVACSNFAYDDSLDTINIDFELYIPSDAVGAKTVGVVAIGTSV